MELEGKIILDIPMVSGVSKAGNAWRKKEWVLETTGTYPRKVIFNVFGDRVDTMTFQVGKTYSVQVDAESREYNGRWYTDLRAYSAREIDGIDDFPGGVPGVPPIGMPSPQPVAPAATQGPAISDPFGGSNETEDLPF